MNPADLANWQCVCGRGPSIEHQVNGYCAFKEGYAAAIADAAKVAYDLCHTDDCPCVAGQIEKQIKALLPKGAAK